MICTSFRVKNILLSAKIYFSDKVLLWVTHQLVTLHSSHSHSHPRPSNNLNQNHKRTKHMLMFLLLLFCSAAGHAQLYSSVWDGKLVSPPELQQQQRSCILGCQLFTEFSHQQSTLPSTGYSVVSKGLRSQTKQTITGRPGVVSNLYSTFKRVILPKARKQHKIETKPDSITSFKYYCCCRAGLLLQQYAVPQHSHSSTLQYTRRQDSTRDP